MSDAEPVQHPHVPPICRFYNRPGLGVMFDQFKFRVGEKVGPNVFKFVQSEASLVKFGV